MILRGTIISDWKKDNKNFILHIAIPANATAEVWVPAKQNGKIFESGKAINATQGARFIRYEKGCAIIEADSGEYSFKSEWK